MDKVDDALCVDLDVLFFLILLFDMVPAFKAGVWDFVHVEQAVFELGGLLRYPVFLVVVVRSVIDLDD